MASAGLILALGIMTVMNLFGGKQKTGPGISSPAMGDFQPMPHFEGLWKVERLTPGRAQEDDAEFDEEFEQAATKPTEPFKTTQGMFNFSLGVGSAERLDGVFEPRNGEGSRTLTITPGVAETPTAIRFEMGAADDEARVAPLKGGVAFEAEFQRAAGTFISHGPWFSAPDSENEAPPAGEGTYHCIVPTAEQFILHLHGKDNALVASFLGRKQSAASQAGPFARYAPTGVLILVFMLNQFLKRRYGRRAGPQAAPAPRAKAGQQANPSKPKAS